MEIQECQLLRKDWESLVKSVAVVQSELKRISVMAQGENLSFWICFDFSCL